MPHRPEIIAHRGLPHEYPENSLPGFLAAVALGAHGIELDVQLTADGHAVVHHDAELGRPAVAGAPLSGRRIASLALAELRRHELAPDIGVPTLAEVLDAVDGRATVYIEIKDRAAAVSVAAAVERREEWTSAHAFDHRLPPRVRERRPALPIGVLSSSYPIDSVTPLRLAGARDLWQQWTMIDAELVDSVHTAGGRVVAWTVNDAAVMAALAGIGVDAICTDVPAVALRALAG